MKNRKEHLKNLFLSEIDLINNDPDYANEILKEAGYNPEDLKKEGQDIVAKIKLKAGIEAKASIMKDKLEKAKAFLATLQSSTEDTLISIQERLNKKAPSFQFNFRDLKELNEADALKILNSMEILDFLDEQNDDDSKK